MKKQEQKEYLFLFADLKGSTEVAKDPELYKKYMTSFHWAVTRAKYFLRSNYVFPQAHFRRIIQNIEIIGDEVSSFTMINDANETEKEDLVASSVSFLYMLELYWLASPINFKKLQEKTAPYEISAGLHIGHAHNIESESSRKLISYHINITKGIQEEAKDCEHSKIYATYDVKNYYNSWRSKLLDELQTPELRPPLVYTGFKENPKNISIRGDKKNVIDLWELSLFFDKHKEDIDDLFKEMATLNDKAEYQAETASGIMSSNYLICKGNPFRYSDGRNAIYNCNYKSAEQYITLWFKALKQSSYTFINSSFMALNFLMISSSFIRHPEVHDSKKKEYKKILENLYNEMKKRFFNGDGQ